MEDGFACPLSMLASARQRVHAPSKQPERSTTWPAERQRMIREVGRGGKWRGQQETGGNGRGEDGRGGSAPRAHLPP